MTQPTTPTRIPMGKDDGGNVVYNALYDSGMTDGQNNHLVIPARASIARPIDALGAYLITAISGTMAAGLAAGAPIFSFRWNPAVVANSLALIHRVQVAAVSLGTAFTAGVGTFQLFVARGFAASDTGGTPVVLTGNTNKLRTSHSPSQVADMRVSSTAALGVGTRVIDTNDVGLQVFGVPVTTNITLLPTTDILSRLPGDGDWPLIHAPNEGFIITANVPATGTWQFAVTVDWLEVPVY